MLQKKRAAVLEKNNIRRLSLTRADGSNVQTASKAMGCFRASMAFFLRCSSRWAREKFYRIVHS